MRDILKPWERLASVFPTFRTSKMEGALMSYQSDDMNKTQDDWRCIYIPLREKGSTTFFLIPFLPFERRLFCEKHKDCVKLCKIKMAPFLRPWLVNARTTTTSKDLAMSFGRVMQWLAENLNCDNCNIVSHEQCSS